MLIYDTAHFNSLMPMLKSGQAHLKVLQIQDFTLKQAIGILLVLVYIFQNLMYEVRNSRVPKPSYNNVTIPVANSKTFIEILLSSY